MKQWYLQITDGYVTDCIEYPYGDYVETTAQPPRDILSGCYKLTDGAFVLDASKRQQVDQSGLSTKADILNVLEGLADLFILQMGGDM